MLIDWFTVGAQVLNFLILVWLMKRFLYKPILKAIDAREARIAQELADADATKAEAQKERDTFQQKNETFDQERAALLTQATEEAKTEHAHLLEEARTAADAVSAQRQKSLAKDARNLNQAITRRVQDEVFAIARKALTDLAGVDLEERACAVFIDQLRAMAGAAKSSFSDALKTSTEPALVRSAFDLSTQQRDKIRHAITESFSATVPLQFTTLPALVSGIELTVNGNKVAWSIADYLTSLKKSVGELLEEEAQPPKPDGT